MSQVISARGRELEGLNEWMLCYAREQVKPAGLSSSVVRVWTEEWQTVDGSSAALSILDLSLSLSLSMHEIEFFCLDANRKRE
jgi:hypothetical protein